MDGVSRKGVLTNTGGVQDFRVLGPEAVEDPGRLEGASFLTFLAWAGIRKATGVLRLQPADGPPGTTLGFSQGSLLSVEQEGRPFNDEAVRWLVDQRILGPAQLDTARKNPAGKSILQTLFEQKACTPQNLVDALKAAKERLLEGLLKAGHYGFTWEEGAPVKRTDPVALDLVAYLVAAIRLFTRSSYASDLDPLLREVLGRYPYLTGTLTPAYAEYLFSDKERKVLELAADGTNTLKDGIAMSLLSHTQTDRLFLIAWFLGFVEFRTQGLPKGGVETLEKELKSTFERLKVEDHFQRLGLHWTTHPKHYAAAFRKMADRWGPASSVRRHSPLCAEMADAIMGLMDEAFNSIEEHRARVAYRLVRKGKETLVFGTDFLFKQANLAVFREDWEQALEIIESAIDILPRQEFLRLRERVLNRSAGNDR